METPKPEIFPPAPERKGPFDKIKALFEKALDPALLAKFRAAAANTGRAIEFKLSFEVPGTVSSINYKEGERYEEGALLVSLRQDDILLRLKRAQAEQKKAETQAKIKEQTVNENDKLFNMGAVPKSTLENARL